MSTYICLIWRANASSLREVQSIPASLQGYNVSNKNLKDRVMCMTLVLSSTNRAAHHYKEKKNNPVHTKPPSPTSADLIPKACLSRLSQNKMRTEISNVENKMVTFGVLI